MYVPQFVKAGGTALLSATQSDHVGSTDDEKLSSVLREESPTSCFGSTLTVTVWPAASYLLVLPTSVTVTGSGPMTTCDSLVAER